MKFYKWYNFGNHIPALPSDPMYSRIYVLYADGTSGYDDSPFDIIHRAEWSSGTRESIMVSSSNDNRKWIEISGNKNCNSDFNNTGYVYYGVDNNSLFDNFISNYTDPEPTAYFYGKYKINKYKYTQYVDSFYQGGYISFNVNFVLDGVRYRGLSMNVSKTGQYSNSNIYLFPQNGIFVSYSVSNFVNTFDGKTIEFEQTEYVASVVNWFYSFLDEIPESSITIKDKTGSTTLVSVDNLKETKTATLTSLSTHRTLSLVFKDDSTANIEWEAPSGSGSDFAGLSFRANSNKIVVPLNIPTEISLVGNVELYECYTTQPEPTTVFNLNLYQNISELERVDKTSYLTPVSTIFGTLREECSVTNPSFILEYESVPNFNYIYIPILKRYYYVTEIRSIRYSLWEINCEVDVLMTYKNAILMQKGFIERNEFTYNDKIVDKKRVVEQGYDVEVVNVPNDVFETTFTYVLSGFGIKITSSS